MDLSFSRRKRASRSTHAIDLAKLLVRADAIQSASPTAQAQTRLDVTTFLRPDLEMCVAIFAGPRFASFGATGPARFAVIEGGDFQTSSITMKAPFTLAF